MIRLLCMVLLMTTCTGCKCVYFEDPQGHKVFAAGFAYDTTFDYMRLDVGDSHLSLRKYDSRVDPATVQAILTANLLMLRASLGLPF